MTEPVLLVRHTAVATAWAGRCYGRSDVGLSRTGAADARRLAQSLAAWGTEAVVHSDLRRTRLLADRLAALTRARPVAAPEWQERSFGTWEGRRWTAIHRETGSAMDGMLDDPEGFRPGGGETTGELARRAVSALGLLPAGRVVVVTHGGPIGALLGLRRGSPVRDWPSLVPPIGSLTELDRGELR